MPQLWPVTALFHSTEVRQRWIKSQQTHFEGHAKKSRAKRRLRTAGGKEQSVTVHSQKHLGAAG